ncbi:ATP-binding cassette domain-containing protein [Nodosilinea sp. AN01ver1]|uniref:ATP-binding cassette domain-containing protein n=1 Tax=Nodosilinea sp. AN01ver1 TaxID=3423362 RepID=UPI003D318FE7
MSDALSLTAYDLWKTYGDEAVVQGISFTLAPGEIVGLLGPNGAGKTTTVGMLFGTVIPTKGFVQFGPWQLPGQGQLARAQMGIVTQEDNLDPDFTVFNNLTHFAHHYRITGAAARRRAGELLALVNLEHRAEAQVDDLSGGMKRRLVLARALLNEPKIVFLDEPTTGLDPDARQDFWRLVQHLKANGCGILLTTHYMDEAQRLCDRLLLLQAGKVIDEGTPTDLVARVIGREVAEVEGVDADRLKALADRHGAWYRAFGSGHLVTLPDGEPEAVWSQIEAHHPSRLLRRPANLEDVFLRLTGSVLE